MKLNKFTLLVVLSILPGITACSEKPVPTKTVVVTREVVVTRQATPVVVTVVATEQATPTATASPTTEPTPTAAPIVVEELRFQSGHFTLVGDLQVPNTAGKHPAIIMVHGDGSIDRYGWGWYRPIMERFLRAGYAVFSWDKPNTSWDEPGTGESTGEFVDGAWIITDRASILVDAVEFLKKHPTIDPQRIGVWGGSQGGVVIPMALTMTDDIAFMIVASGPGVNGIDQTAYLIGQQMLCQGYSEEEAKLAEQSFADMCKATTYEEYRENMVNLIQFPPALSFTGAEIFPEEEWIPWDPKVDAFFDPITVIEKTTIPVLAFFGEKDTQVDPFQGAQAYEQALQKAGNQHYRVELIPGVNHGLVPAETGCMDEALPMMYAPEYLDWMEEWLVQLLESMATATETITPTPYPEPEAGASVRTYGGQQNDAAYDILLLDDGGTLIAGQANNTGLSHRITPGNAHLIRTDAEGEIVWEKDYGGEVDALFCSLIQVGEDEYVALGDIAASYEREETDFYLVKIDEEGHEIWSHTYGGRGMDIAKMVRQTADGGFILVGDRADELPTGDLYQSNLILIKTDAEGNEVWSRTYGDEIFYLGWGVAQTSDGGYVLTGWEAKTIDDRDVIAIKTDEAGNVEWSRTWDLAPGERDGGFDLILTSDGSIVIACIQAMGSGAPSAVLIKADLEGNEIWNKLIGKEGVGNTFWHIIEDTDGGYVMAGDTHLGKVPATGEDIHGGLMIKTDADGEILWQHIFGKGQYEQVSFRSAVALPDDGYVFVGQVTQSGEQYSDMVWLKLTTDQKAEAAASASYWPTDDWRSSTPEEQGMDSTRLEQMMAYIDEHDVEFDSVIVVRHGYIVLEEYFNGYDRHDKHHIQCVTKGFTSALIGIALDKGFIESVDQKMVDFFPDYPIANMDARKQQITLEHLLTMYDGLDWHENDYPYTDRRNTLGQMWASEDAVQYVLDRPMVRDPGTEYFHNSGASILLGGILEQATGQDVYSFARKYLFDPIGIGDVQWERTTGNHHHTDGGLHMTPRDMARFGYLYLNHGTWDGQEIVSSEWVNRSTSTYHQSRYIGFGYHWYTFPGTGIYAAAGHYEQWIYVIPEADMVVVFTGQIADDDPHPANELLQDFILDSLH